MDKRIQFFDALASQWDKKFYSTPKEISGLYRHSALYGIKKGHAVLEVGCGTGAMFGILRRRAGKNGKVIAVDFSRRMIGRARKKFYRRRRDFYCADAHELPFDAATFDRVVFFSSFPHFESKPTAVREAARVLKPGGIMAISHLCSSRRIAAIHRRAGKAVESDALPRKAEILRCIRAAGLALLDFRDRKGLYLVKAQKL